jgi:hypothetical protein
MELNKPIFFLNLFHYSEFDQRESDAEGKKTQIAPIESKGETTETCSSLVVRRIQKKVTKKQKTESS